MMSINFFWLFCQQSLSIIYLPDLCVRACIFEFLLLYIYFHLFTCVEVERLFIRDQWNGKDISEIHSVLFRTKLKNCNGVPDIIILKIRSLNLSPSPLSPREICPNAREREREREMRKCVYVCALCMQIH